MVATFVQTDTSILPGGPSAAPQVPYGSAIQANGTSASTAPSSTPTNTPTLPGSLFPTSALGEWVKILIFGSFFELCRRIASKAFQSVYDYFVITLDVPESDYCWDWIMYWLSKQPSWRKTRKLELSTDAFGLDSSIVLTSNEENNPNVILAGDRRLSYMPSQFSSHSFWYKGCWCRISRWEKEGTQVWRKRDEYLRLSILSRDHQVFRELVIEAEKAYKAAQQDSISIYTSESNGNGWRHLATRPKRPLSSIVLDPGVKDKLVRDAREFLESKEWYAARGIPFRRGYLLHGAPGSGKTSIIQSLAGELGLDIYIVSLSRVGLDDDSLNELISRLPEKCIALMEDIDAAFTASVNRDSADATPNDVSVGEAKTRAQKEQKSPSRVTLSGLLNALDGVAAQEGRLLFATTNKYSALDPALTRPGRMDLHIEFKLASKHQAKELYRCFYSPDSKPPATGATTQTESHSPTKPRGEDHKEPTEKTLLLDIDDVTSTTSEQTTAAPSASSSPKEKLLALFDTSSSDSDPPATPPDALTVTLSHTKTPILSESQIDKLATVFSEILPEREFSMASLQGYLMLYKTRPVDAISELTAWIEKERREKREREEKKQEGARAEAEKSDKEVKEATVAPTTTTST